MNFSSDIQACTVNLITNIIQGSGREYFFGGSRRFGFEFPRSDVDILVYDSCDLNLSSDLIETFASSGMPFVKVSGDKYGKDLVVYDLMGFIHIILFDDWNTFLAHRYNHDEVEKRVRANPVLIDLAREMKQDGRTGSEVYDLYLRVSR